MKNFKNKSGFNALFVLLALVSPGLKAAATLTESTTRTVVSPTSRPTLLPHAGIAGFTPGSDEKRMAAALADVSAATTPAESSPVSVESIAQLVWNFSTNPGRTTRTLAQQVVSRSVDAVKATVFMEGPTVPYTDYRLPHGTYFVSAALTPYLLYRMLPKQTQNGIGMVTRAPNAFFLLGTAWLLWRNYKMSNVLDAVKLDTTKLLADTKQLRRDTAELKERAATAERLLRENEQAAQERHKAATADLEKTQKELEEAIHSNIETLIADAQKNKQEAEARHEQAMRSLTETQEKAAHERAELARKLQTLNVQIALNEDQAKARDAENKAFAERTAAIQKAQSEALSRQLKDLNRLFEEQAKGFTPEQRQVLLETFHKASAPERQKLLAALQQQTAEELQAHADTLLAQQRKSDAAMQERLAKIQEESAVYHAASATQVGAVENRLGVVEASISAGRAEATHNHAVLLARLPLSPALAILTPPSSDRQRQDKQRQEFLDLKRREHALKMLQMFSTPTGAKLLKMFRPPTATS